jgi:hypothetical protein
LVESAVPEPRRAVLSVPEFTWEALMDLLVTVTVESAVRTAPEADGKVIVVASVPVRVRVLFAVRVFPLAMVRVALVAGAVMATLLILVAVATPRLGVTSVAPVAPTTAPLPVVDAKAPILNCPPPAELVWLWVALEKSAIVGWVRVLPLSV